MAFQQRLRTLLLLVCLLILSCTCFADNIGIAKRDYSDETHVSFQGSVIASFTGKLYIENTQGIQGIRVDTSKTFAEGTIVNVNGVLKTDWSNAERYVLADANYPQAAGGTQVIKPRGMAPASLVGGTFGIEQGLSGTTNLNNLGLLVRVSAPVSSFDDPVHPTTWFKINSTAGPEIKVIVPSGVNIDIDWAAVTVTGICSAELVNGSLVRVIKVRSADDIVCNQSWADNKVATMTLDQKVGQMFIYKFTGTTVTSTIISQIQAQHVAGYCISQANSNMPSVTGTANLANSLQTYAMNGDGIPLLISTDQEGGEVTRLNSTNGGTPFPGNMSVGASRSYDDAFTTGATLGSEIKAVGINIDNAPVLDCNTNPSNPIIDVRSFGEDPTNTGNMGHGFLDGLHSVGCIATGKHFPGHGDTSTDSHTGLPIVTYPYSTLNSIHGKPFRDCAGYGIDCIMTAHIIVTCLDSALPATLSPTVLNGYLRGAITVTGVPGFTPIGFNGVCMTDSMGMGALTKLPYTNDQECAMALEAGNDLVLWPNNLTTAIAAVKSAITNGDLPESEVNKKVARVIRLKRKYGLFQNPYVDAGAAAGIVGSAEHKASELAVARDGITVVKNANNILPLTLNPTDRLWIVATASSSGYDSKLLSYACPAYHSSSYTSRVWVKPDLNQNSINIVLGDVSNSSAVIVSTLDADDWWAWDSSGIQGQIELIKQMKNAGRKVIVIGQHLPYEFASISMCDAYLCTYYYNNCNLQAAIDAIFGAYHPIGLLPVTVSRSYPFGWGLSW